MTFPEASCQPPFDHAFRLDDATMERRLADTGKLMLMAGAVRVDDPVPAHALIKMLEQKYGHVMARQAHDQAIEFESLDFVHWRRCVSG